MVNSLNVLYNEKLNRVEVISEDKEDMLDFMVQNPEIVQYSILQEIDNEKTIDKYLIKYSDLMLCNIDGLVIREKDVHIYNICMRDEKCRLFRACRGIVDIIRWRHISKAEKRILKYALKILLKYTNSEEKIVNISGIKDMANELEELNEIDELNKMYKSKL